MIARADAAAHLATLTDWAAGARVVDGFGWCDARGVPDPARPVELWITCRMTHVLALSHLLGAPDVLPHVDHGVAALSPGGLLHDAVHGGWFSSAERDRRGAPRPTSATKEAYGHSFVILAAASAVRAGAQGAGGVLEEALVTFDRRFWDDGAGLCVDAWDTAFGTLDGYRGVNANMHLVEALLAAHDVTGDAELLRRALRVTRRVVQGFARDFGQRLPEHYDVDWTPRPDLNRDRPDDRFRPYGVTIGHLLEWSRLAVHVRHAVAAAPAAERSDLEALLDGDLLDDARLLFARAVADGWDVDGASGFVYTTDFDGLPVVRARLHWVAAEALAAAHVLAEATGEETYRRWCATWWAWSDEHLVDRDHGSWHHELDVANRPASTMWPGKPDVYHAFQALLVPHLPAGASFVGSIEGASLPWPA